MESDYQHTILVVERDEEIRASIADILREEPFHVTFSKTGESGLKQIRDSDQPFSLIISALALEDIWGTEFLEQARDLSPDSIRFLMAMVSDMDILIRAINQGAVQRFFMKPFGDDDFLTAVRSGIRFYNSFIENKALLSLAKQQNGKLYELTCRFLEETKANNKTVQDLDSRIDKLKENITRLTAAVREKTRQKESGKETAADPAHTEERIEDLIGRSGTSDLESLFTRSIDALYLMFVEQAERNGFEMSLSNGDRE